MRSQRRRKTFDPQAVEPGSGAALSAIVTRPSTGRRRIRRGLRQSGGEAPGSWFSGTRLSRFPVDPARLVDAFQRNSWWIALIAVAAGLWASHLGKNLHGWTARAQIQNVTSPGLATLNLEDEAVKPYEPYVRVSPELFDSPELHRRVAQTSRMPLSGPDIAASVRVNRGLTAGEAITVTVVRQDPTEAVLLANTYLREAMKLSSERQDTGLRQLDQFFRTKLADTDRDVRETNRRLLNSKAVADLALMDAEALALVRKQGELISKEGALRTQVSTIKLQADRLVDEILKYHPVLVKAREDLDRSLLRYTDEHPRVIELKAAIADLRTKVAQQARDGGTETIFQSNSTGSVIHMRVIDLETQKIALEKQLEEVSADRGRLSERMERLPEAQAEYATLKAGHDGLNRHRDLLAKSQSDVQFLLENASSPLQVLHWAREDDLLGGNRGRSALLAGLGAATAAALLGLLLVSLVECTDGRIKTARDLERATGLPVLASLGDMAKMSEREREDWAFRTLTMLRGRLGKSGSQPLICGFISATSGEGRSTWVNLLAGAAQRYGHQVVVVSSPSMVNPADQEKARQPSNNEGRTSPTEAERRGQSLATTGGAPGLQLSIPQSEWSLEWRSKWRGAIQQWKSTDNLVLLVELPPASNPHAVLLSAEVPQLIWLCSQDRVSTIQTRSQMETLRSINCGLVGAVLNRASVPSWKSRFAHWTNAAVLILSTLMAPPAPAQTATVAASLPASISVSSPDRLADWQKRLTLGAGDVVSITIYDEPDSVRAGVSIGPDGRINYLEAQDVMAAGLTVDELRARLDEALTAKGHRSPRTVIIPSAYNSKRFYMLGNVSSKGVFPLNRPITLVEAVAQARGFVSRDGLILADLSRSFWIRKGADGTFAPLKVDFEAVFLRGDLAQNLPVAPEDYLYFPPGDSPDIYVLGEVLNPGVIPYNQASTAMRAVIGRGGFTERAYQQKILVIRGSLSSPETFIVDLASVLRAKRTDFRLQPRDIVYVSRKPWYKVEELLELALSSFVRAATITWVGDNIDPIITNPIF